jgi:hypothetical protein
MKHIAIVGGGIAGTLAALKLSKVKGSYVDLYEQNNGILQGPPYCHLHAGGFLYPEISSKDSQALFKHALDFAMSFPDHIVKRPSVIAYRSCSNFSTSKLIYKCKTIRYQYACSNESPFGNPELFYAIYNLEDFQHVKEYGCLPNSDDPARVYHDPYVLQFCKLLDDANAIKFPFVSVCEPGINKKSLEACLREEVSRSNISLVLNHHVRSLSKSKVDDQVYDIIVNATGYQCSELVPATTNEIIEKKSSWYIRSSLCNTNLPEIAIIGERSSNNGMVQISPVPNDSYLFQVHCMTNDSTVIQKWDGKGHGPITRIMPLTEIETRGNVAVSIMSDLFSAFNDSVVNKVRSIELCGIQRIACDDINNRVSSLVQENGYFEIRLVKAMSAESIGTQLQHKVVEFLRNV